MKRLPLLVAETTPETTVTIARFRDGRASNVTVKTTEFPKDAIALPDLKPSKEAHPGQVSSWNRLQMKLLAIRKEC